jgi:hypothetical protein
LGVIFEKQNSGHWKATLKDFVISDPLTISLHNPATEAAKDLVRYVTKYYIIKIAALTLKINLDSNKDFKYYESICFDEYNDLNYDKLKNQNIFINRSVVIDYIKQCFLRNEKINIEQLLSKSVNKGD